MAPWFYLFITKLVAFTIISFKNWGCEKHIYIAKPSITYCDIVCQGFIRMVVSTILSMGVKISCRIFELIPYIIKHINNAININKYQCPVIIDVLKIKNSGTNKPEGGIPDKTINPINNTIAPIGLSFK